ncbi:uncharacterized protein LOC131001672 isoform X2 [Salvia miltiorrhiza]|uniref:uncharacterized protein LOC131001672 isoform X2 n=1 Tax=Salvia miltiorrhiza TaxID=226208 RepID=UPI0025ACF779|nr:uncharacterized protein LOC131001672 isoform X2 [Salvia miltiorrhiza]
MDLPLQDSSDDVTSFASKSEYYTEDDFLDGFSYCHGLDMLEEDALNEKSCMQVLKIWIDKANEDIVKLEEDILMLQRQLVWDDEKWSKQCSAALREKIDQLAILIERLKKDSRENGLHLKTEELPPRLHDLKPLLENYLAKSEQTETSMIQMPVSPTVELINKKIEENSGTIMLKTYERKSKSTELEERKICPLQQKDAVIRNFDASGDMCTNDEVSKKVISKPNTLEPRRMLNLVHVKLEPADPMVKESSASTSIEKVHPRENPETRNNDNKAITEAKAMQGRIQHEIKVDPGKARTEEASNKVQEARVLSMEPSVKTKGRNTKILQTQEAVKDLATEMKNSPCSLNDITEQVKRPRMELEHQIQVQQKICNECQQILKNPAEHEDHLMGQKKDGVLEKETEQQVSKNDVAGPSEGTAASNLLPQEARKLPLSSQTTSKKGGLKRSLVKQAKTERDASNSTAEEATDGVKNVPQIPSPCIKDKEKLLLSDLRAIAKSQNLHGYYRLRKDQLQKLLGLE